MKFAEKYISRLSQLKNCFHFKIERVHLLFHDCDSDPSEGENAELVRFVCDMNRDYFGGRPVLKLRSKPNFKVPDDKCSTFIRNLLAGSKFPMCDQLGSFVNIEKLIHEMYYIMKHHNTNLDEIRLSVGELRQTRNIEKAKEKQLISIAEEVKSTEEGMSLVTEFNKKFNDFMSRCETELITETENVYKHVETALKTKADKHRLKLTQIEYCYHVVKSLNEADLCSLMEEQLEYFYRESWWINTFVNRANELKLKLENVRNHYPREATKLANVNQKFEIKLNSLWRWFAGSYGTQVVTTLLSGGIGIAAKCSMVAATAFRLGVAAAFGGVAAVGHIAFGATRSLIVTETSSELYSMNKRSVTINGKLLKSLNEAGGEQLFVLMLIGTQRTMSSYMLNEFVHQVSPFTPSSLQAFDDSKLTQILHFSYQHPDHETGNGNNHAFIIYLRIEEGTDNCNNRRVMKIAAELIPWVSMTCISFDTPEQYAETILNTAFTPTRLAEMRRNSSFQPTITAIYPQECVPGNFFLKLREINVRHIIAEIERFDEQGAKLALVKAKEAFDKSVSMSPRILLEVLQTAENRATLIS